MYNLLKFRVDSKQNMIYKILKKIPGIKDLIWERDKLKLELNQLNFEYQLLLQKMSEINDNDNESDFQVKLDNYMKKYSFQCINEFQINDVFIVGYPKSGNTWMQYIISSIYYGIDPVFLTDKMVQELVPDIHYKTHYKRFGETAFFKSHSLPMPEYKKVIYMVRDVRDVMVSYFHFLKIQMQDNLSWCDLIYSEKGLYPCTWCEHISTWLNNPYQANIHVVRYEDLINDTLYEIKKICHFLSLERSEKLLEKVVLETSFKSMQSKEILHGFDNQQWQGDFKSKLFFRKGKFGSYKEEMPIEFQDYLLQKAQKYLILLGYLPQN